MKILEKEMWNLALSSSGHSKELDTKKDKVNPRPGNLNTPKLRRLYALAIGRGDLKT